MTLPYEFYKAYVLQVQIVSQGQKLPDGPVLGLVTQSAEILLIHLFFEQGLVTQGSLSKHAINQHQVLPRVMQEWVCLHLGPKVHKAGYLC